MPPSLHSMGDLFTRSSEQLGNSRVQLGGLYQLIQLDLGQKDESCISMKENVNGPSWCLKKWQERALPSWQGLRAQLKHSAHGGLGGADASMHPVYGGASKWGSFIHFVYGGASIHQGARRADLPRTVYKSAT